MLRARSRADGRSRRSHSMLRAPRCAPCPPSSSIAMVYRERILNFVLWLFDPSAWFQKGGAPRLPVLSSNLCPRPLPFMPCAPPPPPSPLHPAANEEGKSYLHYPT